MQVSDKRASGLAHTHLKRACALKQVPDERVCAVKRVNTLLFFVSKNSKVNTYFRFQKYSFLFPISCR
jgi:hypothetical protein